MHSNTISNIHLLTLAKIYDIIKQELTKERTYHNQSVFEFDAGRRSMAREIKDIIKEIC